MPSTTERPRQSRPRRAASPRPPARRARSRTATIAARIATYLFGAWGVLIFLAWHWRTWSGVTLVVAALYTTIPLVIFARWRGWPFYPRAWFRLFVVRPFWYAQLLLPVVGSAAVLGMLGGALFGNAVAGGQVIAGGVLAICLTILLAGYFGAHHLVVRDVEAAIVALPPEFDGVRIVQLSDLHVGPHVSQRFLRRVARTTRALEPDLLALTGDLVDDRAEDVPVFEATFGTLQAPLGKYIIAGNHDVYAGWDAVERAFAVQSDATMLVNDVHVIRRGEAQLALVGTGDPAGGYLGSARVAPDITRALSRVPEGATVVALAHNPALWPLLAERGVALTLSGHTHWGQLAIPSRRWSLASPFLEQAMLGHQLRDALLYISPGTGYWGVPFRLGAFPEITVVTLRRSDAASLTVHRARAA